MTEQTKIRRDPQWLSAWVGNELMMMNGTSGFYVSASQTGGRIWELLEQPQTVAEVILRLSSEYEAPEQQVREEGVLHVEPS
jgi:hypothetical protein